MAGAEARSTTRRAVITAADVVVAAGTTSNPTVAMEVATAADVVAGMAAAAANININSNNNNSMPRRRRRGRSSCRRPGIPGLASECRRRRRQASIRLRVVIKGRAIATIATHRDNRRNMEATREATRATVRGASKEDKATRGSSSTGALLLRVRTGATVEGMAAAAAVTGTIAAVIGTIGSDGLLS